MQEDELARRQKILTFLFFLAIILALVYVLIRPAKSEGVARVVMIDVGQGDSFLIEAANGKRLLIDGGKDSKALTGLAKAIPRGDRTIDIVIATHPDADHIGGLTHVLSRYKIGLFLTSEVAADTEVAKGLYEKVKEKNIPAYYVRRGMNFSFNDSLGTNFEILFPDRDTKKWETNTASVVGRLEAGERSALFTGDAPSSIEEYLIFSAKEAINVDILKLGHHGSKTSTSVEFLRATSPLLTLISAGKDNSYGHPAPEVIEKLKAFGVPYVSTPETGTYTLKTDGTKWYK